MTEREQKLEFIRTHIQRHHVGWRNAVSMKALCAAAGLRPSELKADHTNKNAGYIPELRRQGHPFLSCNRGYYWPRPVTDPEGRAEDLKKCESRLRNQGLGNLWSASRASKAELKEKYPEELMLEF